MSTPQPTGSSPTRRSSWTVRDELQATLAARGDLGPEWDDHLVQAFLEKIERSIDQRVDARLALLDKQRGLTRRRGNGKLIALLALAIPLSGIAGGIGGLYGLLAVWAVILILGLKD